MALPERRLEGSLAAVAGGALPLALSVGSAGATAALSALVLIFALLFLFRIGDIRRLAQEIGVLAFGFVYIPLLFGHLALLRGQLHGVQWVFLLLVIVMAGDTGAYYVGSTVGRHKLYPVVSPNKSIEGALGGLVGSIAGAFIARGTFFPELTAADCLATALLFGVLGQLGDLFESLLKRSCGVKDSGGIIPGHGGLLDRMDSIIFAAPAAFYYARYLFH